MDFKNSLLFMPLMVGSIFILVGIFMFRFSPKTINALYGYRTKSSMKTQKSWNFAQKYSSKLLIYCGLFLVIISQLGLLIEVTESIGVLLSSIWILLSIVVLFYKTETAIKKNNTYED